MKKLSFIVILLSFASFAHAQKNDTTIYFGCRIKNDTTTYIGQQNNTDIKAPNCSFYSAPRFPGGEKAFHRFIYKNLRWPEEDVRGSVFVSVIIEKDGRLSHIRVIHSTEPMVSEALRIIKLSPKWIPAKYNGKAIRHRYITPFRFDLNE